MKKILTILALSLFFFANSFAGNDGELNLSKKSKPVKDCFEPINRFTFAVNMGLDKVIFKPVAKGYRVLPPPVRASISNVLDNLTNLVTIPNNVLQGEFKKAGINTGRFVINTTIGILGLIDVAQNLGFPDYEKEDYGQSLAKHGVGPGCYMVLPVLGPSTVRDAAGSLANIMGGDAWYNVTVKNDTQYFSEIEPYHARAPSRLPNT